MLQLSPSNTVASERQIGCLELFTAFCSVGISGFGGVLPWARRMMVDQRRWLTEEEFTNILSLCQFLPGANIVNVSICVGSRFAGFRGAVSAFSGLLIMPVVIVLLLAMLYAAYGHIDVVQSAFRGISSAAAGLIVAMTIKMILPLKRNMRALLFIMLVMIAVLILKLPLVWILLALVPPSILASWILRK